MSRNIDKRIWGVLGKQQTFYSPQQQIQGKTKTPLNANAFDSWDMKRSRFRRIDGYENAIQQGGTVIGQETPTTSPIPSTPTPTPSFTPTQTTTPTITPSSTPYILPETPALWYDATNLGSIDYISSGGTDYVSTWRSVGTVQKALTGATTDTMPNWSGSSQLPGSPLIVRFNKNSNTALREYLTQRFDSTSFNHSGLTVFYVFANPGLQFTQGVLNANMFGFTFQVYSGNTTNGGYTPIQGTTSPPNNMINLFCNTINTVNANIVSSGVSTANSWTNITGTSLNNKWLYTQVYPYPSGNPYFEINQSGGTMTTPITGTTATGLNAVNLGITLSSGGTITAANAGVEIGEIMVFKRELSVSEQEQVQNYLRDKWRYDEWASPVPTATPTGSPTQTPSPTTTTTNTPTQTQTNTPSPTPSGAPASGTTEALIYLNRVVQSGGTVDSTASAATITLFTSIVSNGLWDKIYAMYPVLGGVSASHSINGKSSGGTYDLTFNGGWTHSSGGMQPNGTNGYAETGFNPSLSIGNGNGSSLGIYVNLQGTVGDRIYDIGVATNSSLLTDMWDITAKRTSGTGNNTLFDSGDYPNARVETTSQASASGMTIGSVRSTTDRTLYRNGSNIATQTTSQSIDYPNRTQIIGAQKNESPIGFYSSNRYAFAFLGSDLTNTDIVNLSSIINTYETSLGRNTY